MASGCFDSTIRIWDISTSKTLKILKANSYSVRALALLKNGHIASGSSDSTVRIWNPNNGNLISTLYGHTKRVNALNVLPNGLLASASDDTTIRIWSVTNNQTIATLAGHTDWVVSLADITCCDLLASGSVDKTIIIWSTKKWKIINILKGKTSAVTLLLSIPLPVSASYGFVLSASQNSNTFQIQGYDGVVYQTVRSCNTIASLSVLAVDANNVKILSGCTDSTINIHNFQIPAV